MCVSLCQALGFSRFSLLGWSDGGITALIAAARNPSLINKMVVWGSNAYVSQQDVNIYNGEGPFSHIMWLIVSMWDCVSTTLCVLVHVFVSLCLCPRPQRSGMFLSGVRG